MSDPTEEIAKTFILRGIQEWGQSDAERAGAVQNLLYTAGFEVKVPIGKDFCCNGHDADAASQWLRKLILTMRRSRFEDEVEHVKNHIVKRLSIISKGHQP